MRKGIVLLALLAAGLGCAGAQDQAQATPAASDSKQADTKQTDTKPADTKPAEPSAPTPKANGDENFTGNVEFGYRFIPNISGSFNTYRSVVDLGEGPKLFGADATILNPNRKLFDRLDLHLTTIGDDPYQTAKLDVSRRNTYRLTVDWRNIAYFNFLPSFANPYLGAGGLVDENSFDTRMNNTDVRLDIMPGSRIVPYLAYGRNSQDGRGLTSFVETLNNYPVATLYNEHTSTYRGGVDFNFGRFHANIEEGGTTFKDDQGASNAAFNPGDLTTTFLGQRLFLSNMNELYRVRGDSTYSKVSFAATPWSWATVSGQFVYAKPRVDVNYSDTANGNLYYPALIQFYSNGHDVLTGSANMPHPSGNLNVELRPWKRLRIVEFFMTDRLHNASADLLTQTLLFSTGTITPSALSASRLEENYNQQEIDFFVDVSPRLTVRVGDRYVWGDSRLTAPAIVGSLYEKGDLSQNVGIGGLIYRAGTKTRANVDYEISQSTQNYFRTGLRNYSKFHVRGSHDLTPTLRFAADYSLLSNSNPDPLVNYTFSSQAGSLSMNWLPRGGKWFTALLDYTRSSVQSSILYIVPSTRTPDTSLYHENAHTATGLIGLKWVSVGGSLFVSSGSRPTQYYQPLARVSVPVYRHISWNAEWRYYGFAERIYQLEGFRSNQVMTSLRLER